MKKRIKKRVKKVKEVKEVKEVDDRFFTRNTIIPDTCPQVMMIYELSAKPVLEKSPSPKK